jgi:uncharacterized protein (DUF433 family)
MTDAAAKRIVLFNRSIDNGKASTIAILNPLVFEQTIGQGETMKTSDRITFDPEQCGGRPCIRHYRIRVKDVLDMLAEGVSEEEILKDFNFLEREDIRACLRYAAEQVNHPVLVAA